MPLPQECHCWMPLTQDDWMALYLFRSSTHLSTPWWQGAPSKHSLGLFAQELFLLGVVQADFLGKIPANPMATSLWSVCAAARIFQVPFPWPSINPWRVSVSQQGQVHEPWHGCKLYFKHTKYQKTSEVHPDLVDHITSAQPGWAGLLPRGHQHHGDPWARGSFPHWRDCMTSAPSEASADWVSWSLDSPSPRACCSPLPDLQHCFFHSISSACCGNLGPCSLSGCLCQPRCDTACWRNMHDSNCKTI